MTLINVSWPKVTIPLPIIFLALGLVLHSWLVYFFLPLETLVVVFFAEIVLLLLVSVLSFTLFRHWRIQISVSLACLFLLLVYGLIRAAPLYSEWYGKRMAERFIQILNVKASIKEQEVRTTYTFDVVDPSRKVTTVYALSEPHVVVVEKVKAQLHTANGWMWDSTGSKSVCAANLPPSWVISHGRVDNSVIIEESGLLKITLYYESPARCHF